MNTPTIPGMTAEEVQSLTPDEIEALQSDLGDDAADELTAIAGDDDTAAADDTAAQGKPAAEKPATDEGDTADDDTPADEPVYKAVAPADAAAQLEAQKAARDTAKQQDREALRKLHDGVIDFEEYEKIKDEADAAIEAANEKMAELKTVINKAEISAEMSQQEAMRAWNAEVSAAVKAAKAEGLDYAANPALHKELNGLVRAFAMEATESGMTDEGLKASKWALAQAQATMRVRHPELLKAPAPAAAQARQPGQPRHNLTTLGALPSADRALAENDSVSRFGQLVGEDLELAMASMSEKESAALLLALDK